MSEPGIVAALVAFQAALPRVEKTSTANTGTFGYSYADLAEVSAIVLPRLAANGLAYVCELGIDEEGRLALDAQLRHVSGEWYHCRWPIPLGTSQSMGSAITYGRRYCLLALCGVHPTGEDDDAQLASKDHAKLAKDTVKAPRKATRATTTRGDEDPWAIDVPPVTHTPPRSPAHPSPGAGADTLTAAQLKMIVTLMGGKGITARTAVLDYVHTTVGRRVESRKDLTRAEAGMLIDALTVAEVAERE